MQQELIVVAICDGTERYSICNRRCSSVDSCAGVMPPGTVGWVDVDDNDDISTILRKLLEVLWLRSCPGL